MTSAKTASLWALIGSAGTRGLSFLFFLLIARLLTPSDLGVMALALSAGMLMDAMVEFGLGDQVVRQSQADPDTTLATSVFWLQTGLAGVGLVMMWALAPWAALHYGESALEGAIWGVAVASVFTALGLVPTAILMRRFEHRALAIRNTVATLVGGCVGLWMANQDMGLRALIFMQMTNAATASLMAWWASRWRPALQVDLQALKKVLPLSRAIVLTRLMEVVMSRFDQMLIGLIFGTATLGVYALAVRLYDVAFQTLCMPISSVALPYLAQVSHDLQAFRTRLALALRMTSLWAPPFFLCGALFLPGLMPVLFGERWLASIPYVQIILAMGAVQAVTFLHVPALSALGQPGASLKVAVVSSVLWLLALFLLPSMGAVFAAVLWAFRSGVGVVMQVWLTGRLAGFRLGRYAQALGPALLASGTVVALALGWQAMSAQPLSKAPVASLVGAILTMSGMSLLAWHMSAELRHFVRQRLGRN